MRMYIRLDFVLIFNDDPFDFWSLPFLLVSPIVICLLALLCMKGVCLAGHAAEGGVAAGAGGVARLQGAAAAQAQGHSARQMYETILTNRNNTPAIA
jgi:hypothetical protein